MRYFLICSLCLVSLDAFAGAKVSTQSGIGSGIVYKDNTKKDFSSIESYVSLHVSTAKSNVLYQMSTSTFFDLGLAMSRSITLDGSLKTSLINPRASIGIRRDSRNKEILFYSYGSSSLPKEKVKYLELGLGVKSNMTLRSRVGIFMFLDFSGSRIESNTSSAQSLKGVLGTGFTYTFGKVTHCDNLFCY
jgi:hypothetical protein